METKKHYVLKTVSEMYGSKRTTFYCGRNWTENMMLAKFYSNASAATKVMEEQKKAYPQSSFEVLYVTITIETLDEVTEREMLS